MYARVTCDRMYSKEQENLFAVGGMLHFRNINSKVFGHCHIFYIEVIKKTILTANK